MIYDLEYFKTNIVDKFERRFFYPERYAARCPENNQFVLGFKYKTFVIHYSDTHDIVSIYDDEFTDNKSLKFILSSNEAYFIYNFLRNQYYTSYNLKKRLTSIVRKQIGHRDYTIINALFNKIYYETTYKRVPKQLIDNEIIAYLLKK